MKINPILLLAVVFALTFSMASAQKKSKEDKNLEKEWKKKLKDLKPLDYKKLVDDQVALRSENQELNAKVTDIESQLVTKNNDLDKLKSENRNLEEEVKSNISKSGAKPNDKGVIFKVQIGAFRNRDLTKYLENSKHFSGDVDTDGTKKYTLGYFGDYWEADNFKKYLREMGVSDAWIVAYKDGQRVEIKEVLEGASN